MTAYKITGTLTYTEFEICNCPDCNGHDKGDRDYIVNEIVDGKDADQALRIVEIKSQKEFDTEELDPGYEWTDGPFAEVCGEDVQMRRMGMPELFSM